MLKVLVHAGNVNDRAGAKLLMTALRDCYPTLKKLWADQGYRTTYLWSMLSLERGLQVEIVLPGEFGRLHAVGTTYKQQSSRVHHYPITPRRWVVERTFAWIGRYRRFSKDYEYEPTMAEALIYAAMSHLMLRRLARGGRPARERGRRPRQLSLPFV